MRAGGGNARGSGADVRAWVSPRRHIIRHRASHPARWSFRSGECPRCPPLTRIENEGATQIARRKGVCRRRQADDAGSTEPKNAQNEQAREKDLSIFKVCTLPVSIPEGCWRASTSLSTGTVVAECAPLECVELRAASWPADHRSPGALGEVDATRLQRAARPRCTKRCSAVVVRPSRWSAAAVCTPDRPPQRRARAGTTWQTSSTCESPAVNNLGCNERHSASSAAETQHS